MINVDDLFEDSSKLAQGVVLLIEEFETKYECKGLVNLERVGERFVVNISLPGIQMAKPEEIEGFKISSDEHGAPSVKIIPIASDFDELNRDRRDHGGRR